MARGTKILKICRHFSGSYTTLEKLIMIGFTMMFWGVSEPSLGTALSLSGAALTTEGFLTQKGGAQITLYIIGGIIGLGIVGLLISFLPTIYSIYSQREQEVSLVAFRFGAPPSGVKVPTQSYRLGLAQELDGFWHTWEERFTGIAETQLSYSIVIFYRSSQPDTSWITTAGAILDARALFASTMDRQDVPWVHVCYQAGCRTLREIATEVGIPLGSALASSTPIQVSRAEYDTACEQLLSAGVALKADREESWHAFVSMRSQYDFALIALANFVYAPKASWSSDRKLGLTTRDLIR
jgi:hypothetical protein